MALVCVVLTLRLSKPVWPAIRAVDSKGFSIKVAYDKSCWVTLRTWMLNLEMYTERGMSGPLVLVYLTCFCHM